VSEKDKMNKKINKLKEKNKLLEDRMSQLETLVQEMYFSVEMKGPGFMEAQKSFLKNGHENNEQKVSGKETS
jgi:hypothetical protein